MISTIFSVLTIGLIIWGGIALLFGILFGKGIKLADDKTRCTCCKPLSGVRYDYRMFLSDLCPVCGHGVETHTVTAGQTQTGRAAAACWPHA